MTRVVLPVPGLPITTILDPPWSIFFIFDVDGAILSILIAQINSIKIKKTVRYSFILIKFPIIVIFSILEVGVQS